jgi:SAM-dependent methyltransferase
VNEDERLRRGSSFGAVATEYAEHRPNYPEDAVRWSLAPAAVAGGAAAGGSSGTDVAGLRVLDLGAGTGKLTAQLAGLGASVTAVEPDQGMLAELRRRLPSVPAFLGGAESIPLPDASVHAVVCGQSLHWFNLDLALPEISRVLLPGGVLAALWNSDDDRVEWVAGLQSAAEGAASPSLSRRRTETAAVDFAATPFFTATVHAEFPHGQRRTADSLAATIATHSQFLVMSPPDRERVLAKVRAYLGSRPETAAGEFTLPMVTSVIRTIRKTEA